jgi:hypothetical protein
VFIGGIVGYYSAKTSNYSHVSKLLIFELFLAKPVTATRASFHMAGFVCHLHLWLHVYIYNKFSLTSFWFSDRHKNTYNNNRFSTHASAQNWAIGPIIPNEQNFDLDKNFITAWKNITKLVIFRSFVVKCCKVRTILPCEVCRFSVILYYGREIDTAFWKKVSISRA